MRSLSNSLAGTEVDWSRSPEPEPARISPFDLACELLADLQVYKEMVSISLGQVHQLTATVSRQQATIASLNTEIRDFLGDRRARSENDAV